MPPYTRPTPLYDRIQVTLQEYEGALQQLGQQMEALVGDRQASEEQVGEEEGGSGHLGPRRVIWGPFARSGFEPAKSNSYPPPPCPFSHLNVSHPPHTHQASSLQQEVSDLKSELTAWREQARAWKRQLASRRASTDSAAAIDGNSQQASSPEAAAAAAVSDTGVARRAAAAEEELLECRRQLRVAGEALLECRQQLEHCQGQLRDAEQRSAKAEHAAVSAGHGPEPQPSSAELVRLRDQVSSSETELTQCRAQLRAAGAGAAGALVELARCQVRRPARVFGEGGERGP